MSTSWTQSSVSYGEVLHVADPSNHLLYYYQHGYEDH